MPRDRSGLFGGNKKAAGPDSLRLFHARAQRPAGVGTVAGERPGYPVYYGFGQDGRKHRRGRHETGRDRLSSEGPAAPAPAGAGGAPRLAGSRGTGRAPGSGAGKGPANHGAENGRQRDLHHQCRRGDPVDQSRLHRADGLCGVGGHRPDAAHPEIREAKSGVLRKPLADDSGRGNLAR